MTLEKKIAIIRKLERRAAEMLEWCRCRNDEIGHASYLGDYTAYSNVLYILEHDDIAEEYDRVYAE